MKDENFQAHVKTGNDGIELVFSGQLTINYMQKIKDAISGKIDFSKDLSVHVNNPDNLDITFLQLLQSLKKTCAINRKNFSVEATLPHELESLIINAGFADMLNSNPEKK
jgi:hypothetical protein